MKTNIVIKDLELKPDMKIGELVEQFQDMGFNAGKLGDAANCWLRALESGARIYLTLAGAMTPAGLRRVIAQAIQKKLVHAIVTTGANIVHELNQGWTEGSILKYNGELTDKELHEQGLFRIFDVLVSDEKWTPLTDWLEQEFYPGLIHETHEGPLLLAPHEIFRQIGKQMAQRGDNGILATSYIENVPIYCPAFMDSDLGIRLKKSNDKISPTKRSILIDQTGEYSTLIEEIKKSKNRGIVILGGGTPKNFTLQCSMAAKDGGFSYAIQFTTDSPHWGGLSGATLSEAISWGKIKKTENNMVTVYSDATITFPIVIAYLLTKIKDTSEPE
jgi:deoxyhypusine synthase